MTRFGWAIVALRGFAITSPTVVIILELVGVFCLQLGAVGGRENGCKTVFGPADGRPVLTSVTAAMRAVAQTMDALLGACHVNPD